jgi:hypothetical protein
MSMLAQDRDDLIVKQRWNRYLSLLPRQRCDQGNGFLTESLRQYRRQQDARIKDGP